jgi:plasmid stabilization system protein ParE
MIYHVVIDPQAEADVLSAEVWYAGKSKSARVRFASALRTTLQSIQENPFQYQVIYKHYRRAMMRPFPYALIYSVNAPAVVVLGCMHGRRNPKIWQDRLR